MNLFYKLLLATAAVLCFAINTKAQRTISTDQRATYLGPKALTFRAFDNNLNGTETDYLILTNTVFINHGTKFSLTNANFSIRDSVNVWLPIKGAELASVEFEYLGLDPIPPASNLCIFIGPEGVVDVIDIFLNGHSDPGMFGITSNNTASINLSTSEENTLYITQGTWNEPQTGEFTFGGSVVDGLGIGLSDAQWQAAGMPGELDPESGGGGVGTGGNGPGDYWGILQCDGLIYICDYLSLQPFVDNWFISQNGDLGGLNQNPIELCDELCDLLCSDCDFEVEIILDSIKCEAIVGEIACEPPFNYAWQKKINGEWISIEIGTSEDGSIPNLLNIYRNNEYRLVVNCTEYCSKISNEVFYYRCPEEPCSADIMPFQNYCHMGVSISGCTSPTYQWYELIDGVYAKIPNEVSAFYSANHGGIYRVEVEGCIFCDELFWDFIVGATEIKTFVETVDLCSYKTCISFKTDSILNVKVLTPDTIDLNSEPGFSFDYPTSGFGVNILINDINNWLNINGYEGEAMINGMDATCSNGTSIIVSNTNIIFEDITYSTDVPGSEEVIIVTQPWFEFDCQTKNIGFRLLAVPGCENYISITWSTGETGESIVIDAIGTYSATVDCGNGCLMTESITIIHGEDPQTLTVAEEPPSWFVVEEPKDDDISSNNGISVYPNPGQGLFTVEVQTTEEIEEISLTLYSSSGLELKIFPKIIGQNGVFKTLINVQEFNSGIYFLKANDLFTDNVSKLILIK